MTPLPIIFTIEDLIGAIMPGMVWSIELFTLNELLRSEGSIQSTFQVAMSYSEKESPFFLGFLVSSVILGYISNVFPTRLSEAISLVVYRLSPFRLISRVRRLKQGSDGDKETEVRFREDMFPYLRFHRAQPYYQEILEAVKLYFGRDCRELPGVPSSKRTEYEAFQHCKRILRWHASNYVWQKIQHLEAQTRMLSSLLLASVFNCLLAVSGAITAVATSGFSYDMTIWLLSSSMFAIVLSYTFQYRRRTEVESILSYTLLLLNDFKAARRIDRSNSSNPIP